MIYTFGASKGGAGKSTLAFNTAVALACMGRKVIAVDTDRQGALFAAVAKRDKHKDLPQFKAFTLYSDPDEPTYLAEALQGHAAEYDDMVIDTAPGTEHNELRSALMISDVVVSPCQPSFFDTRTLPPMDALVYGVRTLNPKLKALAVLNRCSVNVGSTKATEARQLLSKLVQYSTMAIEIKGRDAFMEAPQVGQSALEYEYSTKKARDEMDTFFKELFSHGNPQ